MPIWKKATKKPVEIEFQIVLEKVVIETREGLLYAYPGLDVIIKGIEGECYPCKIDIFKKTYEYNNQYLGEI